MHEAIPIHVADCFCRPSAQEGVSGFFSGLAKGTVGAVTLAAGGAVACATQVIRSAMQCPSQAREVMFLTESCRAASTLISGWHFFTGSERPRLATVDASLPNRQALKEPTTNARPLVIEAVTISQTASVSASTKGTPKTEKRSIESEIYYGSLTLLGPKGARVSINGKRIRKRLPLVKYKLPTGKHRVQVTKGKFRRNVLVNVTRSQNTKVRLRKKRRSKRR